MLTLLDLRSLGITLSLSEDKEHIIAGPKENLTDELRSAIYANRDDLIRTLLFKSAAEWVGDRPFSAPDEADQQLNDAFYGDLAEYREALRVWAKAGLEARRKAA